MKLSPQRQYAFMVVALFLDSNKDFIKCYAFAYTNILLKIVTLNLFP